MQHQGILIVRCSPSARKLALPGDIECQLRVVDEALEDVERVRPRVVGGLSGGGGGGGVLIAVGDLEESGHGGFEQGTVAALPPGKKKMTIKN